VALLFELAWKLLSWNPPLKLTLGLYLERLQLVLWPSSIILIASAGGERLSMDLLLIAVAANMVLYGAIGAAITTVLRCRRP